MLGEFELIARLHRNLAQRPGVRLGIGDDAAVLEEITAPLVTCDALVEGVHFRRDWTQARDLGWKSMAVNVSDIAAMGGAPVAAFVSLAVPRDVELHWIEGLYAGMEEAAAEFAFTVAGGDTVKSLSGVMLSITLVGNLIGNAPRPILRSGARPGDALIVTGTLGDSAAGLHLLLHPETARDEFAFLLSRHHRPQPRVAQMHAALQIENAVHAALDLSDGIAGDAAHIARASGVSLEIDVEKLPFSPAARALATQEKLNVSDWALRGGEDYELLLCVAAQEAENVCNAIEKTGTRATIIGRVVERQSVPVWLIKNKMREAATGGFAHF